MLTNKVRFYDNIYFAIHYDAAQNSFLALVAPDQNGGSGTVAGHDMLSGDQGQDNISGADGTADTFVFAQGGGRDFVHDFETAHDQLDLPAFGIDLSGVPDVAQDQGWATLVDLSRLQGERRATVSCC